MIDIIIINGSPSSTSRSSIVTNYIGNILEEHNYKVDYIHISDVPANDLLFGNFDHPEVKTINEKVTEAKGVIISSPVYQATYTGALKTVIDLFARDAFQQKPVLPMMVGGSSRHLLALDYGLKPLIHALKGEPLQGLYFQEDVIARDIERPIIREDMLERTKKQVKMFMDKVNNVKIYDNA